MICHRIGLSPISTMGLGFNTDSSLILLPFPPAKITTFIDLLFSFSCILQHPVIHKLDFSSDKYISSAFGFTGTDFVASAKSWAEPLPANNIPLQSLPPAAGYQECLHLAQGAIPAFHRFSIFTRSRYVSTGVQNPVCLYVIS